MKKKREEGNKEREQEQKEWEEKEWERGQETKKFNEAMMAFRRSIVSTAYAYM